MRINLSFLLCTFLIISEAGGQNSSLPEGKVIGGSPVTQEEVKFMASLKMNLRHFCSGCVISPKHILSPGQCIYFIKSHGEQNYANTIVWLGSVELYGSGITRNVKDLEHHPQFNPSAPSETCAFDIGVILLDRDIVGTNLIDEITYPSVNIIHNMKTEVIGWGPETILYPNDSPHPIIKPPVLQKMLVRTVGTNICQTIYYKLKYDKERLFCTEGGSENTTHQGGIGNPLLRDNKLLGVTIQIPILVRGRLAVLFIKVAMFNAYIEEAKIRLIENQNWHVNNRNDEQC